jgi:ketosteroid isomerase-like protein
MSQENIEVARLAYAAVSERDIEALAKLTDSEWSLTSHVQSDPRRGVYGGHEQIAQFGAATEEAFERFELSPIESRLGLQAKSRSGITSRRRVAAVVWNWLAFRT